jgi:hypothetical protein
MLRFMSDTLRLITMPAWVITPFVAAIYAVYKVSKWKLNRPSLIHKAVLFSLTFVGCYGATWMGCLAMAILSGGLIS